MTVDSVPFGAQVVLWLSREDVVGRSNSMVTVIILLLTETKIFVIAREICDCY